MVDWAGLAATKYAIEQRRAAAAETDALANLTRSGAAVTEANAQAGLQGALARQHDATTDLLPGQAISENKLRGAQAGHLDAMTADLEAPLTPELAHLIAGAYGKTPGRNDSFSNYSSLFTPRTPANSRFISVGGGGSAQPAPASPAPARTSAFTAPRSQSPVLGGMGYDNWVDPTTRGFSHGTAEIEAPGDGTVDTQPAMLADGEAVLNKAAAEHLGRDFIEALNTAGVWAMGLNQEHVGKMGDDKAATNKGGTKMKSDDHAAHGYAKGTSKVSAKAPAKGRGMVKKGSEKPMAKGGKESPNGGGMDPHMVLAQVAQMARQKTMGMG